MKSKWKVGDVYRRLGTNRWAVYRLRDTEEMDVGENQEVAFILKSQKLAKCLANKLNMDNASMHTIRQKNYYEDYYQYLLQRLGIIKKDRA